jgi:hypothetical protein
MPEVLTPEQETDEVKIYDDFASFVSDFSKSEEYTSGYSRRMDILKKEHPGVDYDLTERRQRIAGQFWGSDECILALYVFYKDHKLNMEMLPAEARDAIKDYWNFIEFMSRTLARYAINRNDYIDQATNLDRQRDRRHVAASRALVGDTFGELKTDFNDLNAERFYGPVRFGRQVVSLITEDAGIADADPDREQKKMDARMRNELTELNEGARK